MKIGEILSSSGTVSNPKIWTGPRTMDSGLRIKK